MEKRSRNTLIIIIIKITSFDTIQKNLQIIPEAHFFTVNLHFMHKQIACFLLHNLLFVLDLAYFSHVSHSDDAFVLNDAVKLYVYLYFLMPASDHGLRCLTTFLIHVKES